MTPSQIITEDHKRFGHSQSDTARLMDTMQAMIKKNAAHLVQHGNSLLFLVNLGNKAAEINFFTADTPNKVKSAMTAFIKQTKTSGFTRVYGENGGPVLNKTLPLLEKLGLKIQKSNNPRYYWMADL